MKHQMPILLIGGPGRSGTNVLKYVFETHSEVYALPFESRFTIDPDGIMPTYNVMKNNWSPFTSELALERLRAFLLSVSEKDLLDNFSIYIEKIFKPLGMKGNIRKYKEWQLDKIFPEFKELSTKLIEDLKAFEYTGTWSGAKGSLSYRNNVVAYNDINEKTLLIFREYLYTLYIKLLEKNKKKFYVEDNTFNILYAKESLSILPSSSLVHMIRDPRDVVASYMKQRWCPKNLKEAVQYYKMIMEQWFVIRKELPKDRFLEVKLEDLCGNTENTLKNICEVSGIPFEKNMLEYPLSKSNTGRWKKEFNIKEQNYINSELKEILEKYNYCI